MEHTRLRKTKVLRTKQNKTRKDDVRILAVLFLNWKV